jgi:hypothetical protein
VRVGREKTLRSRLSISYQQLGQETIADDRVKISDF